MPLTIDGGITLSQGIRLSPALASDPSLSLGTSVEWSSNTIFDTWTSSSSTTTDGTNNVTTVWQMFYTHRALRITNGFSGARIGTYQSGSNSWNWWYSVSTVDNTQNNFGSPTAIGSGSASYVSGGTYTNNYSATVNIPAFRYFLIGRVSGPFYYASRTLASNRTAVISSIPYFTVINKIWRGGGSSGTPSIPTQLGGLGTYTEATSISQVAGFSFVVV